MTPADTDDQAIGGDLEDQAPLDDENLADDDLGDDEGDEGQDQDELNAGGDPAGGSEGGDNSGRQPGRATRRIQTLEKERDEYRQKLDEVLLELRKSNTQPAVDSATARAEAERLAAMEPVERALYESNKRIEALQNQVSNLGFHTTDTTDRARFEAKAEINPIYKKYQARVEEALQGMRKNGANTTREALLTYMIGEDARKRLENKPSGEQRRRAAATRVDNSQGRPANVRSDTRGTRSDPNSVDALEKRLSGVAI